MIGNPINYDKKQTDKLPNTQAKIAPELRRYMKLIEGKEVLDLGIGQGQNSIFLFSSINTKPTHLILLRFHDPQNTINEDFRNHMWFVF